MQYSETQPLQQGPSAGQPSHASAPLSDLNGLHGLDALSLAEVESQSLELEQTSLPPRSEDLPPIPNKRYFTIGEVSAACGVKQHVLRFWEQEFPQLRPAKRRGNRRYYQHHEVLLVRRIRELLYDQGYTILGAQRQLRLQHNGVRGVNGMDHALAHTATAATAAQQALAGLQPVEPAKDASGKAAPKTESSSHEFDWIGLRQELQNLHRLLVSR